MRRIQTLGSTHTIGRQALAALLVVLVLGVPLAGTVTATADPFYGDDADMAASGFPDPFERTNRATFRFNRTVDRWVIEPMVDAYQLVPAPARRSVRRFLSNLDSPAVFVNDVLQLEMKDAGVTFGRFAINSTVGFAGLFDPASELGMPSHRSDFGQTLALLGVPSGPYLVLPVVGPTTARDGTGYLVDFFFRPTTYLLTPGLQLLITPITEGTSGLAEREAHDEALHALEASSVDFYAALRNAYYQDRLARIWARRERRRPVEVAARPALDALALPASGGEIRDLAVDHGDERLEAVALQD